jgi:hypothetical protein
MENNTVNKQRAMWGEERRTKNEERKMQTHYPVSAFSTSPGR